VDCDDPDCVAVDDDGDGSPTCADCAPTNQGSFRVPVEVPHLDATRPSAATARLSWADERAASGSATLWDVARGRIPHLLADAGFSRAVCLARDVAVPRLDDAETPSGNADGWWYLVGARNACGAGAWGVGAAMPCP